MGSSNNAILSSFEEIKRNLDPAFSYIVFERDLGLNEGKGFSEVIQALSCLRKKDLGWQIYNDEARGIDFLLVKMEPGQDELIMKKIVDTGLPQDFICSFYKSPTRELS